MNARHSGRALAGVLIACGLLIGTPGVAFGGANNPAGFVSLGDLLLTSDSTGGRAFVFNTDTGWYGFEQSAGSLGGILSGPATVFTFNAILVGTGVRVTATGSRPLVLLSQSSIKIMGTIDVGARFDTAGVGGYSGGTNGSGYGPGGGGHNTWLSSSRYGTLLSGGGGGGYGGLGGEGGGGVFACPAAPTYGDLSLWLLGGSGGASGYLGSFPGGGGGGAIEIGAVNAIEVYGSILADGGPGTGVYGAGGGSGGGIWLHAGTRVRMNASSILSARGGAGAPGSGSYTTFLPGGGGGGGRILLSSSSITMLGTIDRAGGAAVFNPSVAGPIQATAGSPGN